MHVHGNDNGQPLSGWFRVTRLSFPESSSCAIVSTVLPAPLPVSETVRTLINAPTTIRAANNDINTRFFVLFIVNPLLYVIYNYAIIVKCHCQYILYLHLQFYY